MLADAIKRVLRASEALAVPALVVDAKSERAKAFYERCGFVAFMDQPDRLYLTLDSVLRRGGRSSRTGGSPRR